MRRHTKILIGGGILMAVLAMVFVAMVNKYSGESRRHNSFPEKMRRAYDTISVQLITEARFLSYFTYDQLTGFGKTKKIGWVSDIHADRYKHRLVESGMLYPRQYDVYLPKVFDALRKQGIQTVLSTGDNVNSGDTGYASELVRLAKEKDMHIIWVKGNHDSPESMATLGLSEEQYYYHVDIFGARIVVLNTTVGMAEDGVGYGGSIDAEQLDWLRNELKTERPVIIAMHVPMFPVSLEPVISDQYTELEQILRDSGKVTMVLSGHFHIPWQKVHNGLRFYGEGTLTRDGMEGEYAVIDLTDGSVNYEYAK